MGTYINIDGYLDIKKENIEKAVQAVRDLNKHDELKRGGAFGLDGSRNHWFAWIPPEYEDSIHSIPDILEGLHGWDVNEIALDDETLRYEFCYGDKWGQHEVFFVAMAPYLEYFEVNHQCDELDFEDSKWRLTMNSITKTVHSIDAEILVHYPGLSGENEVNLDTYSLSDIL